MPNRRAIRLPVDIQEDYQLTREQVMAALAYATHVAEHLPPAVKSA
jgi:uncharacterized protein (DUF433 family)